MSPRQRLITPTTSDDSGSPPPTGPNAEPLELSAFSSLSAGPPISSSKSVLTSNGHCPNNAGAAAVALSCSSDTTSASEAATTTASAGGGGGNVVDIQQRDRHDIFNLIALPLLLLAALANWDISLWIRERTTLQESWHDSYIYELIGTIMLYFLVDLVWVSLIPSCVKSPGTIVKHHIVALIYNLGPIWYPEYRCFMGVILSVELNTWFLIFRRVLFLRKDSPYVSSQMRDIVDYAFYSSWIVIRVLGYNAILMSFFPLLALRFQLKQSVFLPTLFVLTQTLLNLMNLKWTYDLFLPIILKWWNFGSMASSSHQGGVKGSCDNDNGNREHTL